jgi:tryptophanase
MIAGMAFHAIEPFRIHSVEPLKLTTEDDRKAALAAVGFNRFSLRSEDVAVRSS